MAFRRMTAIAILLLVTGLICLMLLWRAAPVPADSSRATTGPVIATKPAPIAAQESEVERRLVPASPFSVLVRTASGAPIEGARVQVRGNRTTTDGTGIVVLDQVPTEVAVQHPNFAPSVTAVSDAMRAVGTVVVVLQDGCRLSGRVTDLIGKPIAGARIAACRGNGDPQAEGNADEVLRGADGPVYQRQTVSAADGAYRIEGLAPGEHLIGCAAYGYVANGRNGTTETQVSDLRAGDNVVDVQMLRLYVLALGFRSVGTGPDGALKSFGRVTFGYPRGITDMPPGMSETRYRLEQQVRDRLKGYAGSYAQVMREDATESERSLAVDFRVSWMGVAPVTGSATLMPVSGFDERTVAVVDVNTQAAYGRLIVTGSFPVTVVQADKEQPPYRTSLSMADGEAALDVPVGSYSVIPESSFLSAKRKKDIVIVPGGVARADFVEGEPHGILLMNVLDSARRPAKQFSVEVVKLTGITAISSIDGTSGARLKVYCEPGKYRITLKDGTFRPVDLRDVEVPPSRPLEMELVLTTPK